MGDLCGGLQAFDHETGESRKGIQSATYRFDRKDDMPTQRDLKEPIPTGDLAGWKLDEDKWNDMLDDYYDLHGWDRETSFPTRKALADLGLEDVANDLERIGKLR